MTKTKEIACLPLPQELIEAVGEMYSDGSSLTDIGVAVGISRHRVKTVVKKLGIYRAPEITGHWDFHRPDEIDQTEFWSRVKKGESCWIWVGAFFGETECGAYGSFQVPTNGRMNARGAHRVSWALAHSRWPSTNEHICHRCDNPACVNPAHLFLGDRSMNMQDMWSKGRNGGTAKIFAERTHCGNGHPLFGSNLIERRKNGKTCRACRECARQKSFASNRRRRGPPKSERRDGAGA